MSIQQFFRSLGEHLQTGAGIKTVYGDPVAVEGKTIIPVARVGYGFGGGSRAKKRGTSEEQKGSAEGEESGGGGGFGASPVGVVEITREDTKFISIGDERRMAWALIIGLFLGIFIGRRRSRT